MNVLNILSILWAIFGLVWLIAWLRTKPTQERVPFARRLLYALPIATAGYLMSSDSVRPRRLESQLVLRNSFVEAIAIFLTVVGIAFAIWARFYLGQNWSSAVGIKVGHQLIRTGPYARVRHPIYSGLLLALAGTALGRGKPLGIVSIALFWLGFQIKSRMEEQFMRKTFGEEYVEYSRSTGALIPKLRV